MTSRPTTEPAADPAPPLASWPGVLRLEDLGDGHLAVTFERGPGGEPFVIGLEALDALDEVLDRVGGDRELRGLLFRSEDPKTFCAGADVEALARIRAAEDAERLVRRGQELFERLRHLPVPAVALVSGTCVGGGLELALACHARTAADDPGTRLGLPEVRLGILPAWGGSSRLPRLIGLRAAVPLVTAAKTVPAARARRLGIVDSVVPREHLIVEGRELLARLRRGERLRRRRRGLADRVIEGTPPGRAAYLAVALRAVRRETRGHYPAPEAALRTMVRGCALTTPEALDLERQEVLPLLETDVHQNLLRLFRITRPGRRPPVYRSGREAPLPRETAVVGGGTMGAGIAALLVGRGFGVRLIDPDPAALVRARGRVHAEVDRRVRRHDISRHEARSRLGRFGVSTGVDGLAGVDLLIEAAPERLEIKHEVLSAAAALLPDRAVVATNTSSFPVGELATAVRDPSRFLGLHFFNPPGRMPLLEVVQGSQTHEETVARGLRLAAALGKTPIVVGDGPGFLVNRLLSPYLLEACRLAEEGSPITLVDEALRRFGLPMGPFRLMDEVGLDVMADVGRHLGSREGFEHRVHPFVERLVEQGKLGRKSGEGFYRHRRRRRRPGPTFQRMTAAEPRTAGEPSGRAICDRLLGRMVAEARRAIGEDLVMTPDDIDIGTVFGIGFPPFRGGLLRWAEASAPRTEAEG